MPVMLRSSRIRLDLAIVIVVAAAVHFTYFFLRYGSFYFPDSFDYLASAKSLLAGHGFLGEDNKIETVRTPGFPLLIALFGARTVPVIVLQHLIEVAIAALLYLFVVKRTDDRLAAMVASLAFALDVPSIHIANKLLSETVFTALLYVVFVMALQRRNLIAIALLSGAIVLVRPIALFYFVVLLVFFLWQRVEARRLIIFTLVALVPPLGWAARNWAHTGVFTVASVGSINLLVYRAAGTLTIAHGGEFDSDFRDEEFDLIDQADQTIERELKVRDAQEDLPDAVRAQYYGRIGLHIIAQHPVAFVELTIRGIAINLFDNSWADMAMVSALDPDLLRWTITLQPVLLFVFALIGVLALWSSDRPMALLIAMTAVYFIVMSAGAEAEARFRVPVVPQLAIAAGVGVTAVRRGIRRSA